MKRFLGMAIFLFGAFAMMPGCDNEDDDAEATVDCGMICARYAECVTNIDVTSCSSTCDDKADVDMNYRSSVKLCESCVADRACAEAEDCWSNCPITSSVTKE